MDDPLRCDWHDLLRACGVEEAAVADQAYADLCRRYAEPHRFYHTLDHIREVLATVEGLAVHARNARFVRLATWLHDVIYDSKMSDNEERSADYAVELCDRLAIADGPCVAELILKTKTHDAGDDADARVLLDADLAVLGSNEATYLDYAEKIRREYAWVPTAAYRTGRRQMLERFLSRPLIYHLLHH